MDEVVFTSKTLLTRDYSAKSKNLSIERDQLAGGYWLVIAAISTRHKVEHLYFHDGGIDQDHFNKFLYQLRKKLGPDHAFLFMDQLMVHKGKLVTPTYPKLSYTQILNCVSFPEGQPIETIFAKVKSWYKHERL